MPHYPSLDQWTAEVSSHFKGLPPSLKHSSQLIKICLMREGTLVTKAIAQRVNQPQQVDKYPFVVT